MGTLRHPLLRPERTQSKIARQSRVALRFFGSVAGVSRVAIVCFPWSPTLVEIRRQVCPLARFEKKGRRWIMNDAEVGNFLRAAHARLDFVRGQTRITVNDVTWVVGFVQGAPYRTG